MLYFHTGSLYLTPLLLTGVIKVKDRTRMPLSPLGLFPVPHLVPRKGLKAVCPLVACLQAAFFLSGQVKETQLSLNNNNNNNNISLTRAILL